MKGAGALVFLAVFFIFLVATLVYTEMPPGKQIYDALSLPTTDYAVLGVPATTLIIAIFNGVVYGIIAWAIFTLVRKAK